MKYLLFSMLICSVLLACNRPMPQPPGTQTYPAVFLAGTSPAAVGTQPAGTLSVTQETISPQTEASSTRPPVKSPTPWYPTRTPQLTSTPYPTPSWCPVEPAQSSVLGKLRVAYASQGNLWVWDEGKPAIQRTQSGDIGLVSMSDDGKVIAYTRQLDEHHAELWAMDADGSNPKRLVSTDEFTRLDGSTDALGVLPTLMQWEPGSHHLIFFTYPLYDALWIFEPTIPWLVDVNTGKVSAAPYHGGNIVYAPNGKQVVIFTKDGLSLVNIDGSDLKQNVLPGYHGIREGEAYYYPLPFWSRDSTGVQVALPEQDEIYSLKTTVSVWRVTVDGNVIKLGRWYAFAPTVYFSPDFAMMAYWPFPVEAANDRELHLARLTGEAAGKSGDAIYLRGDLTANLAWSPDSQHFIFQMGDIDNSSQYFYLGGICQRPEQILETAGSGAAHWVDTTRFLLEKGIPNIANQWELHLGKSGQEQTELLGVVSAYDWAIIP